MPAPSDVHDEATASSSTTAPKRRRTEQPLPAYIHRPTLEHLEESRWIIVDNEQTLSAHLRKQERSATKWKRLMLGMLGKAADDVLTEAYCCLTFFGRKMQFWCQSKGE